MIEMPDLLELGTFKEVQKVVAKYKCECDALNENPQGLVIKPEHYDEMCNELHGLGFSDNYPSYKAMVEQMHPYGWHRLFGVPIRVEGRFSPTEWLPS